MVPLDDDVPAWAGPPRVSRETPGGKGGIRKLKIQMGLSCNFACTYCSQRFVPHAEATAARDLEPFLQQLPVWFHQGDGAGVVIELWGGEPLAYWKVLRPLGEALRERYPAVQLRIITNGSLMDAEKVEWLDRLGFIVGISHDGPGQHIRGPDPLADPPVREAILDLYRRLRPAQRVSFNACISRGNQSRAAIQRFFQQLTGDQDVPIGEGELIDAYDAGGLASSLPAGEAIAYRRQYLAELRGGIGRNFQTPGHKMARLREAIHQGRPTAVLGQKCGMDRPDNLAVDLKGNVITCQNVSAVAKAPNGEGHRIGHVSDLPAVKLTTATHWSFRPDCSQCPVLPLCLGSCMFLEGELFRASCDNAYSDNAVLLAATVEWITGFLPVRIDHPSLPPTRQWLWQAPPKETVDV